jgi:hypothetical protein
MEGLIGRASSRFIFVTLFPNAVYVLFVAAILASGAPAHDPKMSAVMHTLAVLTWRDIASLLFLITVIGIAVHPFQQPIIQLLEGYWLPFPGGAWATDLATRRYVSLYAQLRADERNNTSSDVRKYRKAASASERLTWLPDDDVDLLPTSLGNTLRVGEDRATARYGMDAAVVMPRLVPLMRPEVRERLADRRNQLDAAARLCAMSLLGIPVSVGLLLPTGHWLFVPLCALSVAWLAYRGAVSAAKGYCTEMAAAVDLHHRDLWRALEIPPPPSLFQEKRRSADLNRYLAGEDLDETLAKSIKWQREPQCPADGTG